MLDKTIAHYEIIAQVGKGGMGEVYRARDTKLDRDVALKILPPEFAKDADRLSRFKREAKTLASLHHPNIASIFGFETEDDCTLLVMELVEGEDLSEVLKRGALPVEDAVDIARQVAAGLEEAHEKGIVHRDLKPANVKRTPDGKVKILDFGLARVYTGQTAGEDTVSSAPTMTAALTQVGTVLGTAAYMSPEQARGKEVDRRADIWAFGVLLFEMLTGKQLFVGETASDTLAGILKSEPEWGDLPDGVPFQVERVLRRCLDKDPRQRLRDIGEARVRLEDPEAESGLFTGAVAAVTNSPRSVRLGQFLPWALVVISVVAVSWLQYSLSTRPTPETLHLAVPAPKEIDFHLTGSFPGLPEISPDGERVAFSGRSQANNEIQLYVRALGQEQSVALSDTKDAQYPFWSPDGNWLAYYVRTEGLMKIPVNGGPPQTVCEAGNGKGGSWNQMGEILLTTDYNTPISVVPAGGGTASPVTDLENDQGFNSHRHPQFLPDGRHFLYFARGAGKVESQIRYASLDGEPTRIVTTNTMMGYYGSGHLVFVSHGDLMAQPFDPRTGTLSGAPTPLAEEIMAVVGAAKAAFSVSTEGTLTYLQGESALDATLTWRDRDGLETEQVSDLASYDAVALSPDGRSAVVGLTSKQAGTWDAWVIDLSRNLRTRFTIDPADDSDFVWSRDSRSIYFASDRSGEVPIYQKDIGSPDAPRQVFSTGKDLRLWDIADDGRTIFYSEVGEDTKRDLWSGDLSGETEPRLLRASSEDDLMAQLSPDGKWLLFSSAESGPPHAYVAPWPEFSPITQVSANWGVWPTWSRSGREIIFQESTGQLVAVSMAVEDGRVLIGNPEPLFGMAIPVVLGAHWDVSADGAKFLTVNTDEAEVPAYCNLVLNWPALVQKR